MKKDHHFDKSFIRRLLKILEDNLENERFGVSELAEAAHVSRSHLHRKVHAYNGNSTSQFIREYRLNKAKELLQQNGQTVAEVAYSVGFSSPTYFNTCFKEHYGYPPGEAKLRTVRSGVGMGEERGKIFSAPAVKKLLSLSYSERRKIYALFAIGGVIFIFLVSSLYIKSDNERDVVNLDAFPVEKSIAVLPFKNWSGDPDLEYISDGMTDAVISRLTRIDGFTRVIPFTSVLRFKDTDLSIPEIARELDVQSILQGNFQLSGDRMKINIQLVNGLTNDHFWSNDYSARWNTDEVFDIQANVAENVANNMNVSLVEDDFLEVKRNPTQNKEAYNSWLKAKYQFFKYTESGMRNAIPLYEAAIRLDSSFVEPYVNLAQLYMLGGASWGFYTEREAWNKAKILLKKARQIDSTHIEATNALHGGLYLYEWDFEIMEENYRTNGDMTFGYCLQTGRYEEALARIDEMSLESCTRKYSSPQPCVLLSVSKAGVLHLLKRTEEALEILKANEKLYSDHFMFLRLGSEVYFYMGEYERSYALSQKILENYPDRQPTIIWSIAACEYLRGNTEKAREYVADLKNKYHSGASGSPAWFTALYYASIEDHEKAIEWLQKSFDSHEVEMIWLRTAPPLKPLRSDPRYLEIYYKVGFPVPPESI